MKNIIGAFILFIGLCIVFFVLYGSYTSSSIQDDMKKVILAREIAPQITDEPTTPSDDHEINQDKIQDAADEPEEVMDILEEKNNKETSEEEEEEAKAKREEERKQVIKSALAILSIPSIDLEVAVSEGLTDLNLKYSVAHYDTSAAIGQLGNACIVGHRNYTYNRFFSRLDEVSVGDDITLNTGMEQYSYTVTEILIVEPKDIWVLRQHTEYAELTLITCTPIRNPTHRLIIKAKLA